MVQGGEARTASLILWAEQSNSLSLLHPTRQTSLSPHMADETVTQSNTDWKAWISACSRYSMCCFIFSQLASLKSYKSFLVEKSSGVTNNGFGHSHKYDFRLSFFVFCLLANQKVPRWSLYFTLSRVQLFGLKN